MSPGHEASDLSFDSDFGDMKQAKLKKDLLKRWGSRVKHSMLNQRAKNAFSLPQRWYGNTCHCQWCVGLDSVSQISRRWVVTSGEDFDLLEHGGDILWQTDCKGKQYREMFPRMD